MYFWKAKIFLENIMKMLFSINTNFHLTVRLMDNFIYVRLITKNDNEKVSPLKTK